MANPAAYATSLAQRRYRIYKNKLSLAAFCSRCRQWGTFCWNYASVKAKFPGLTAAVVEPEGSILNGGASHSHLTEGIGVEFIPPFFAKTKPDVIYTISDREAFEQVKQLALTNSLFVGSSSGAALAASLKLAKSSLKTVISSRFFPIVQNVI